MARGKGKAGVGKRGRQADAAKAPARRGRPKKSTGRKNKVKKTKSLKSRVITFAAAFLLAIAMVPLVLGLIYRVSWVHPVSVPMLADNWNGLPVSRLWVKFDDVSPVLVKAVIMSEDGQFCSHRGVDWSAINAVIGDAIGGEKTRGASTISMQVVKNLFLWNSRSYFRKVLEVPLAIYVDLIWSKRRQMEIYLNIAEWGPGIYGIEAAAVHHFKRSAARLSTAQAALLAVTLPNPALRDPNRPSKHMRALARINRARIGIAGSHVRCLVK